MRTKRSHLAIVALVCALITALILATSQRAPDPVHDGRRLSEWLLLLSPASASSRSLDELSAAQEAPKAIRALGTNALPHLIQAITVDEGSPRFRRAVGWLNTRLPFLQQSDLLRRFVLGRDDVELRRAGDAILAFKILGPTAKPAIPALTQLASSNLNWSTTRTAIGALEAIGPPAQSALVGIIATNRNPAARAMAIGCLHPGEHAAAHESLLIGLLSDPDLSVVRAAVRALGRIQARPELVVPALTALLKNLQAIRPASGLGDKELILQQHIVLTLDSFGDQSHAAVPVLIEALLEVDNVGTIACQFMKTLVTITQDPAIVVPVLTRQLANTNGMVRSCSAKALADLGAHGRSALPALTNALQHADTRQSAAYAIQRITAPPPNKVTSY